MKNAKIRVDVAPGVFKSERSVSFKTEGRSYAMIVDASDIHGNTMNVQVLEEKNDQVVVALPREPLNAGRRVTLPKSFLVA